MYLWLFISYCWPYRTLFLQQSCKWYCKRNACLTPLVPPPPPPTSLSSFLLLHALKYWCVSVYTISAWVICLRRMNKQDVMVVELCCHLKKRNRIKYKPHGDGIGNQPVLGTLFPSHCNLGLSLPLSSIVPWHKVFVCHLLEETCSAAGFTPSPSALPCLNTSPWLWFITTLLLSPNPLVMLPVLARPKIEDLSPRSRL